MKNRLYMVAVLEKTDSNIPHWTIAAASQEYERTTTQYKCTTGDRLLLDWELMNGVCIIRANLNNMQMSEDFTNINMPLDNISGHHRAGLYGPVFNTISDFMRS
jgi:hypothetical protein